jgi:Leucine-rich repeat (LRR) protein
MTPAMLNDTQFIKSYRSVLPRMICAALLATFWLSGCSPTPSGNLTRATTMEEAMKAPDKVLILDLFYRQLKTFPADILKLQNLQHLTLRTCPIGTVPDDIATLRRLTRLDLGNSSLTSLNPAITMLPRLERLWLNDNSLTNLPSHFERLAQLQYLNLDRNQLTHLPEGIGQLRSLRWLRVNDNQLTRLPSDLNGLAQNLEILYLVGNPLSMEERDRIRKTLPKCKVIY